MTLLRNQWLGQWPLMVVCALHHPGQWLHSRLCHQEPRAPIEPGAHPHKPCTHLMEIYADSQSGHLSCQVWPGVWHLVALALELVTRTRSMCSWMPHHLKHLTMVDSWTRGVMFSVAFLAIIMSPSMYMVKVLFSRAITPRSDS